MIIKWILTITRHSLRASHLLSWISASTASPKSPSSWQHPCFSFFSHPPALGSVGRAVRFSSPVLGGRSQGPVGPLRDRHRAPAWCPAAVPLIRFSGPSPFCISRTRHRRSDFIIHLVPPLGSHLSYSPLQSKETFLRSEPSEGPRTSCRTHFIREADKRNRGFKTLCYPPACWW